MTTESAAQGAIQQDYRDELHAEILEDLRVGEFGYKYRILDGVVMPPYITPSRYALSRSLDIRSDDVVCTSYPKSGTNWISNVILRLQHGGGVPEGKTLRDSMHWVASSYLYPRTKEDLDKAPSPRLFSSHMPYHMALGGDPRERPCRYVYVARNPKDVVVSYFHFEAGQSWSGHYSGSWSHWLQMFVDGKLQRGDWFHHVLSWWRRAEADNVHFVKYEDLTNDFHDELKRLARFLDVDLTDELAASIAEQTQFRTMKGDTFSDLHDAGELGHFYRKGVVGSWKERFTVHQSEWFDEIYRTRMSGTGLDFVFE